VYALHEIEDVKQYGKNGDDKFDDYWTKEELLTISGDMYRNIYDKVSTPQKITDFLGKQTLTI
jgi:hypothetical protein